MVRTELGAGGLCAWVLARRAPLHRARSTTSVTARSRPRC